MSRDNITKHMKPEELEDMKVRQCMMLDDLKEHLGAKNDAQLAAELAETASIISKFRSGRLFMNSAYQIKIHELTGWTIKVIKVALNVPTVQQEAAKMKADKQKAKELAKAKKPPPPRPSKRSAPRIQA